MERIDFDEEQDIFINTEESFLGELNGEISFVVSSKPISRFDNNFGNLNFEFNKKFATSSLSNIFSWNVLQTANTPEFDTGNNSFNEDQAKLNINFRRGSNKSGFRNKNEMINISVSNIPSGYKLVEKINDEFRSVGATDKFGTFLYSQSLICKIQF